VLVYPKVDQDVDVTFEAGGHEVRSVAMDLRKPIASEKANAPDLVSRLHGIPQWNLKTILHEG